ncbi:MAG: 7-carboxy-7-deazaguanine synthase QueE [Bacillota bacterium]|nr:7-carboxy-7-deazaguanine synthase QueE [Bacillota bacterium]
MSKLPIMEIFGPTIQGEGMVIGQKTMFVRTAGCDYSCSWCDSSFTWDGSGKSEIKMMDANEIWAELKSLGGDGFSFVTISGGNPALLGNLNSLVDLLKENNIRICLETQGSKWQDWFIHIDELTISPKPPSSKMITNFSVLDSIINNLKQNDLKQNVSLKVVIFDEIDFEYAKGIYQRYEGVPIYFQVGNEHLTLLDNVELTCILMKKYEWLINKVMEDHDLKNIKVLPQLHTFVWGNKRGV